MCNRFRDVYCLLSKQLSFLYVSINQLLMLHGVIQPNVFKLFTHITPFVKKRTALKTTPQQNKHQLVLVEYCTSAIFNLYTLFIYTTIEGNRNSYGCIRGGQTQQPAKTHSCCDDRFISEDLFLFPQISIQL